jgi:hypothetical protein
MKGDIAFVGFMLTADEWHQLDTEARASLIAVATRRADPFLEPPRRLAEGTGKHEAVAADLAQGSRPTLKIDIAGGTIDASPDDEVEGDLDELLEMDAELEHMIELVGADGELEDVLRFEALDHEAALAAAEEMAAAGVAPPLAPSHARECAPVAESAVDLNWAEADDDLQWAEGENWAKHGDVNWASAADESSAGGEPADPGTSPSWTDDDDLNWADL